MRKSHEAQPPADQLAQLGYEQRDVALPTLVKWLIILFVFIAGMIVFSLLIYRLFVPAGAERSISRAHERVTRRPPEVAPIVQARPRRDMINFRREEEEHLNTYGWVDAEKGVVRLPIDRAIELTAQRGFPTRAATQARPPVPAAAGPRREDTPPPNGPAAPAAPVTGGTVPAAPAAGR